MSTDSRPSTDSDAETFAFISLLRDDADARGLARMLEVLARSGATPAVFLVPDVRGVEFFAARERQPHIQGWWARHVPDRAIPVYLLAHQQGLAAWLRRGDGVFLVAADEGCERAYAPGTVVRSGLDGAALALAEAVVTRYGSAGGDSGAVGPDIFDLRDAGIIARIRGDGGERPRVAGAGPRGASTAAPHPNATRTRPRGRPALPPLLDMVAAAASPGQGSPSGAGDPLVALAAESARLEAASPAWNQPGHPAADTERVKPARIRRPGLLRGGARRGAMVAGSELAALLLARAPTIVVVGSRKGGVGKTSHAAGMAIAAGEALDSVGHMAALVDANIANPDAWGQLNLPGHAATVRDMVAALTSGADPPPPIHSTTPALACYPERREGVEYSRTDIHRLALHLRVRYAFVVVDMSNRLPDPMSGPEATVASYWLEEADALVLPTAMSRQDFNGVLDYLDVAGLPPTVVPCIVSNARRNRRHPVTRQYLDVITERVEHVLEVPDEADSVRLAGMDGVPVQDVSTRMRAAYRSLTEAVVRLPARVRA